MQPTPTPISRVRRGDLIRLPDGVETVVSSVSMHSFNSATSRFDAYGLTTLARDVANPYRDVPAGTLVPVVAAQHWPWVDAVQEHWLNQYRLPAVFTTVPTCGYHVAVLVPGPDTHWPVVEPTETEAKALASYLAYRLQDYTPSYVRQLAEQQFDVDSTVSTVTFGKMVDGSWHYSVDTWTMQPFHPPIYADDLKLTVIQVLDVAAGPSARWVEHKAAHPEVFGPQEG